jgi:hypothetical protein
VTAASLNDSSNSKTVTATCTNPGTKVLGGGVNTAAAAADLLKLAVVASYPSSTTAWTATVVESQNVNANWTITVYVICGQA